MTKHFATLDGIKRAAKKLKRRTGIPYAQALEQIAREAGYADYFAASQALGALAKSPVGEGSSLSALVNLNRSNFSSGDHPHATATGELHPVEFIEMSPELAAALRHQHDLDFAEAAPHAPEPSILHRGIRIESRYSSVHELETMSAMMDALPDLVRARIESIWCDSKACAFYTVEVKAGRWMQDIEHHIRDAARAVTDGFNGLVVREGDREVWFDPEWEGDEHEYGLEEGELPESSEADMDDIPL